MAYKFPDKTSLGRVRGYCAQVIGGCLARAPLAAQVAAWQATRATVVELRSQREAADDLVLTASVAARIDDAEFEVELGATSALAFELAGKDAKKAPYVDLFGKDDAQTIKGMGPVNAASAGATIVKDGRRLEPTDPDSLFARRAHELQPALDKLEAATNRLASAASAVASAKDGLFKPRQTHKKLVADVNALIATTEAAILTAFPGRDDIVAAILLPWFERNKRRKKAASPEGPDPLAPDIEDEGDDSDG